MKTLYALLVPIVGLAACQEATLLQVETATVPEAMTRAALEPATSADVTARIIFAYPASLPVDRPTGKVVHRTGSVFVWTVSGDLTGLFTAFDNNFLVHRNGSQTGHGAWSMDLTVPCQGRFEGRFHAVIDPDFTGTMVGQGMDGCNGRTLRGSFAPTVSGNNFDQIFTGTLHEPNANGS